MPCLDLFRCHLRTDIDGDSDVEADVQVVDGYGHECHVHVQHINSPCNNGESASQVVDEILSMAETSGIGRESAIDEQVIVERVNPYILNTSDD